MGLNETLLQVWRPIPRLCGFSVDHNPCSLTSGRYQRSNGRFVVCPNGSIRPRLPKGVDFRELGTWEHDQEGEIIQESNDQE